MGPEQDSKGKFVNVYENLFNLITNLVDMMKRGKDSQRENSRWPSTVQVAFQVANC